MKKIYLLSLILLTGFGFSQTKEDAIEITKNYDLKLMAQKKQEYINLELAQKQKAYQLAAQNGWPITITDKDGSFKELINVFPDGTPMYQETHNVNAAKSTRANFLNTGGGLGLTLNGQNMVPRVWDGGTVRRTHNSFSNRVTTVDDPTGTTYIQHATHVCGTIMASASIPGLKGMAFEATARTFDWTNDEAEATDEATLGMLLSNHSYGVPSTTAPTWAVGGYSFESRIWDEIVYLAPYYLPVMSAGNNGNDVNNNASYPGLDKLVGNKNCKNNLVIANAQDANIDANGNLVEVFINSSSSQGPSDDFRIKPDITGNGTSLTSTSSANNTATAILSGTSMAAPNVTGTLTLIQQHYKNVTNKFMFAATLKALVCGTADDAGNYGPDPIFGWGLLNAKKAAETINNNGLNAWVSEETLNQGQTFTLNVTATGLQPLNATVAWTDVPGVANSNVQGVNYSSPALVNDLDVRIFKISDNSVSFPWKLDSSDPSYATNTSDNSVDNVEQVSNDNPTAGEYKIVVTHKGVLVDGKQNFGLVITGITSSFALISKSPDAETCTDNNAVFNFDYKQNGNGTTTFSTSGLPAGVNSVFSSPTLSANGSFTLTLNNLTNVSPGEYTFAVIGNNGSETETRYKTLKVYSSDFQSLTTIQPANTQNSIGSSVVLKWNKNFNAKRFDLQVATNANFLNPIVNEVDLINNQYALNDLLPNTNYFWRVTQKNDCATNSNRLAATNAFVFTTGISNCNIPKFTATNFSNAAIATTANAIATVPVTVSGGNLIGDINVTLKVTHTYIQDMTISLVGPASIGSPVIILLNEACGDNDNIDCIMDDSGVTPVCSGIPSLTGNVLSFNPLSNLNGLNADGVWTLKAEDPYNGDGGSITGFELKICGVTPSPLSIEDQVLNQITVYPNPTNGLINVSLNNLENVSVKLYDLQGREVLSKNKLDNHITLDINNLQNGVYILSLEKENLKQNRKIILNK